MNRLQVSAALAITALISYIFMTQNILTETLFTIPVLGTEINIAWLLFYASVIALIHQWTPLFEQLIAYMTSSVFLEMVFIAVVLFGFIALFNWFLSAIFGVDVELIQGLIEVIS